MNTNVEKLVDQSKGILLESKNMIAGMDELSEWNSIGEIITNFKEVYQFIIKVTLAVEIASDDIFDDVEGLKSKDKAEAAAQLLDDMVDLPFFLEAIDKPVFVMLISMAVQGLNSRFGKDWNLDAARESVHTGSEFFNHVQNINIADEAIKIGTDLLNKSLDKE